MYLLSYCCVTNDHKFRWLKATYTYYPTIFMSQAYECCLAGFLPSGSCLAEILVLVGMWSHQSLSSVSWITFKLLQTTGRTHFLETVGLIFLFSCCVRWTTQLLEDSCSSLPHGPLHSPSHNMAPYFLKAINGDSSFRPSLKCYHMINPGPPRMIPFLINLKPTDLGP